MIVDVKNIHGEGGAVYFGGIVVIAVAPGEGCNKRHG
jgi:hypothetical protein